MFIDILTKLGVDTFQLGVKKNNIKREWATESEQMCASGKQNLILITDCFDVVML